MSQHGATSSDTGLPDIASAIEEYVASNHSPSGIVAVARGGEILGSQTWGDDGYGVTTPFRIASLTKSFTALALLILRREGLIELDDAVAKHLPELKIEAPADWPTLRIRHLVSMSAGLATDNPWGDRQESRSREELGAWLASGLRLVFPPGTSFEYSNLGYAFLGEVIARLARQDYRQFVRERIIDPLGLSDTRFAAYELDAVAQGYHREPPMPGQRGGWTPQVPSGPGAFSPIGGLYSSVRDLTAWAQLYLSREVPAGVGFTAADLLEAQQPLTDYYFGPAPAPLRGYLRQAYGYGLGIEKFTAHGTVVAHAGGYPGFTAYMCWHQESGYTVIASANGTHSAAPSPARSVLLPLVASSKIAAGGGLAAVKVDTWPETLAAVAEIESLVRDVRLLPAEELAARHAALFAENVELDFPLVRRIEYLEQALVSLGRLRNDDKPKAPAADRPSQARWTLKGEFGKLELHIEMAPVAPYRVQTFSAEIFSGAERTTLF